MGRPALCVCVAALLTVSVVGLYEDQIGKFDWRRQFIGRPNLVEFPLTVTSLPDSVYIASDNNAIASVDLATGELKWRHCFEDKNGGSIDVMLLGANGLLVVRNRGIVLECLNPENGALRWQVGLQTVPCNGVKLLQAGNNVFVATGDSIRIVDSRSGVLRLNSKLPVSDEIVWVELALDVDSEQLYIVVSTSNNVHVFSLAIHNTAVVSVLQLPISCSSMSVVKQHLVCVVASKNEVILLHLGKSTQQELKLQLADGLNLRIMDSQNFCLTGLDGVQCFRLTSDNDTVKETLWHSVKKAVVVDVHPNGQSSVVISTVATDSVSLIGYSLQDGHRLGHVQLTVQLTEPFHSTKIFVPQPDHFSSMSSCMLVVTADNTVFLLDVSGKVVWTRYESLSAVISAELVDLPLSEMETIIENEFSVIYNNVFHMFTNRIVNELLLLKSYLLDRLYDLLDWASLVSSVDWLFSSSMSARQSNRLVRDHFGLHKLLVVTTAYGRVFGMDSMTGQILWTFRIGRSQLLGRFFPIFVQRTTATHPYPAQCATALRNASTGRGLIVTFNPITGDIFETVQLPFALRHISMAPFVDPTGVVGLLLWPQGGQVVYVYPRDAGPNELMDSNGMPVYLLIVDPDTSIADSFQLLHAVHDDRGSSPLLMPWAVSKVFSLQLTTEEDSQMVDFKMKALDTKVHSQGRVLGNRSVLYKYLNPNVGVALIKTPNQGSDAIAVFAFDTVTSRVLYVAKQKRVLPPYHLLVCENWIVYSYWNEKFRRTEISVIEMYEGQTPFNSTAFSSAEDGRQPLIYHQSYIFPQLITAVAVTDTEKAITPRFLMLAMPFGGVVEIPKSLLDPRREVNLTQELRDEGVIPYAPDLPVPTEHIVNYNRSVLRVRGIYTSPTAMESTSLVFVYGLDIFLTRVSPSGTFDVLKDGFDHWFIVAVLLALSSAAIVTRKLARQKDIRNAWR